MPLPFGHAAIGLTTQELFSENTSAIEKWRTILLVAVMANVPDIDVLLGLVFKGNGSAFHRGPTHSLIFAVFMGFLASNALKLSFKMPKMRFGNCFLVIFSHLMADLLFTASRVSFFWPFEVHWAQGFTNWVDIMCSVFIKTSQDAEIITASALLILLKRYTKRYAPGGKAITSAMRYRMKRYVLLPKYLTNLIIRTKKRVLYQDVR